MSRAIVIGGGPAGLMAAERLAAAGVMVDLYDAMASVGRKFLLAGKGGLNLTHSEDPQRFVTRFGARSGEVARWLQLLDGPGVRDWAAALGVPTMVGTSGRVFPADLKAAPLLRAWLHRLRAAGVHFHMRHRWIGWADWADMGALRFVHDGRDIDVPAQDAAVLLCLGGASWPQLGSDGAWWPTLQARGIGLAPLRPANSGFDLGLASPHAAMPGWSEHFAQRFAGQPVKPVSLHFQGRGARSFSRQGEFVITAGGVEGSLIYAASALLRDEIAEFGQAVIELDLLPQRSAEFVATELTRPRGSRSLSTHLKSRLGIEGLKAGLLHETLSKAELADAPLLARHLKRLPLCLMAARPVEEAISTAGGVLFEALDGKLMLQALPGVFCAGEMLDWEAPTGGYLLTACLASGRAAGDAAVQWLRAR